MIAPKSRVKEKLYDPVTRHMRTDFARLQRGQTIAAALASVRAQPPEGRIIYFYVVDNEDRLVGVVPTRRLLLSPNDTTIAAIMVKDVIALPSAATVLDACEFFTLHRLLAFPIVDENRRMLGVVDVELYTEELSDIDRSERNDALFQLVGVHLAEAQQSSPLVAFRRRFPWLLCNIGGGVAAAILSGFFQDDLKKTVALALFIPVVLALAESVSIQSVSLALRALQRRQPTLPAILAVVRAEAMTGLLLGLGSALVVGVVALVWLRHLAFALSLLGGIAAGVFAAAVIGVSMPNLLRFLRRDPQVAAGPIALAASDLITLLVYYGLARALIA